MKSKLLLCITTLFISFSSYSKIVPEICMLSDEYDSDRQHPDNSLLSLGSWDFKTGYLELDQKEKEAVVLTSIEHDYFRRRVSYTGEINSDYNTIRNYVEESSAELYIEFYKLKSSPSSSIVFIYSFPGDNKYGSFYLIERNLTKIGTYADGSISLDGDKNCPN